MTDRASGFGQRHRKCLVYDFVEVGPTWQGNSACSTSSTVHQGMPCNPASIRKLNSTGVIDALSDLFIPAWCAQPYPFRQRPRFIAKGCTGES